MITTKDQLPEEFEPEMAEINLLEHISTYSLEELNDLKANIEVEIEKRQIEYQDTVRNQEQKYGLS